MSVRETSESTPASRRDATERAAWSVADQGLSSLTNFALTAIVARSVSPSDFGEFALVLSLYFFVSGLSQGLTSTTLLVRFAGTQRSIYQLAASRSAGAALVVGMAAAAVCVVLAIWAPLGLRVPLLAMGLFFPGLMLQDAWRFTFVAEGKPRRAFLNDAVWMLTQAIGFGIILETRTASVPAFVIAWGAAATFAAVIGTWQAKTPPKAMGALSWFAANRDLSIRYALESIAVRGAGQLVVFAIGAGLGFYSVGALRGAQIIYSPLNSLYIAALFALVPEGLRFVTRQPSSLGRLVSVTSTVAFGATLVWILIVWVQPWGFGHRLLGATWLAAQPLVTIVGMQFLAIAMSIGPQVGLRSLRAPRGSLLCQVVDGTFAVGGTVLGMSLNGVVGAVVGLAIGSTLGAIVWWVVFLFYFHRARHGIWDTNMSHVANLL